MFKFKKMIQHMLGVAFLATILITTFTNENVYAIIQNSVPGQNVRNINLTPGGSTNEMRFSWHSGSKEAYIRIWPAGYENQYQILSTSDVRAVAVHEGNEPMGSTNVVPTRPGFNYYLHQTAVYNLIENTLYEYVIVTGEVESTVKSFRTGGSNRFQFGLGGDPQIGVGGQTVELDGAGWVNTLEVAVRDFELDFFVSVGDQVQTMLNSAEISQIRHDQLFSAPQLAGLPLVPVVGNHDGSNVNNTNIRMWPFHYNLPMNSDNVRRFNNQFYTQFDYYFVWGDVLFIVLDSNTRAGFNTGGPRAAFVEDAMKRHDVNWTVALFHHATYPVYRHGFAGVGGMDSAIPQLRADWAPELERLGVDIVIGGHEHIYSRSHHMLNNIPQLDQQWINSMGEIVTDVTGSLYNAVLDPIGLTHISINTASGSGYRGVRQHPRPYVAAYNQNWRRNVTVADVTPYKFSIATYQINDDSTRTLVDIYTIIRSDEFGNVPQSVTYVRQMNDETFERVYNELNPIVGISNDTEFSVEGLGLPTSLVIETDIRNNDFVRSGIIGTNRSQNSADFGSHVVPKHALIEWNLNEINYNPLNSLEQTFNVYGKIILPSRVVNTNNLCLNVVVSVTIEEGPIFVIDQVATASVRQIPGNENELTITINEVLSNNTKNTFEHTLRIRNNTDVIVTVGDYRVFVSTRGNTQIREIFILD